MRAITICAVLCAAAAYGGTVSEIINEPFADTYHTIVKAVNGAYGSSIPSKEEGTSITLIVDDICWTPPNFKKEYELDYRDYILPAYIYSLDAEVKQEIGVNVKDENDKTRITIIMYWTMETGTGWLEVESNNEQELKLLNYIIDYYNNPSRYDNTGAAE